MQELLNLFAAEQPKINEVLKREASVFNPLVQPVIDHVLEAGGKRLRPILTVLFARMLGYTDEAVYPAACSLELLHSATLLHDDILDDADLRRGRPAAHVEFGTTETILAGDALLALANRIAARYDNPRLLACLSDAIIQTVTGEIEELAQVRNAALSAEDYLDIIIGKTGWLISASCAFGVILAGADEDTEKAAADFGLNLGIAFQLVDDALDYAPSASDTGKPVGGDLREGKTTLPLVLYMESLPDENRAELSAALEENSLSEERVREIAQAVHAGGFADMTRDHARRFVEKSAAALASLPAGHEKSLLEMIQAYVLHRNH